MIRYQDELGLASEDNAVNQVLPVGTIQIHDISAIAILAVRQVVVGPAYPTHHHNIPMLSGYRRHYCLRDFSLLSSGHLFAHDDIFRLLLTHILYGCRIVELPDMLSRTHLIQKLLRGINCT